jgi:hypothetical protein
MDAIKAEEVRARREDGLTKDLEADGADAIVGRRGNEVVHRGARGQRGRRTYCSNFATGCDCFWVGLECEGGGHEDRREGKGRQMLALGSTGLGCEGSAIVDDEERTDGGGRDGGQRIARGWADGGR